MHEPSKTVDIEQLVKRIFSRFTVRYGVSWMAKWPEDAMQAVERDWQRELQKCTPWQIHWALENLGDHAVSFAPNVAEFAAICRKAPRQPITQILPRASGPGAEPLKWTPERKQKLFDIISRARPGIAMADLSAASIREPGEDG